MARRCTASPSGMTYRATWSAWRRARHGVEKHEAGAFDDDAEAADLLQAYEAKIAALERMVGRQALELELLKGALRGGVRPRRATTSVVAGPLVSPSPRDAG